MKLSKLLENVDVLQKINYKDHEIFNLYHNSQEVQNDSIYFAIDGFNVSGKNYVMDAINNGAKVIVTNECLNNIVATQIVVNNVRKTMSIMAKNFYNKACDKLKIISIVGTAGKTTTSMMIANILNYCDKKCAVIGTNGIFINNIKYPNTFTTPDPITLHRVFKDIYNLGVEYVVMEVSAQAIYLNKMYGVCSTLGVFTNISNEHLDFFKTMNNYSKVKCDYFCKDNMQSAVINVDDEYGRKMYDKLEMQKVSVGIDTPSDVFSVNIEYKKQGTHFILNYLDMVVEVESHFLGKYNVYNLMSAISVVLGLGVNVLDVVDAIKCMPKIDGRLNEYTYKNSSVYIDFAHTPDSIDKVLQTISSFGSDIVTIFGAVGYSDKFKRECMGSVVSKYSSKIIITTDNIGFASFIDVAKDIMQGIDSSKEVILIEDREYAIRYAMDKLKDNECLAILGKGHEDFQMIKGVRVNYSDKLVVQSMLTE